MTLRGMLDFSGIPFDLSHCAGNFAMALLLYRPCRRVLTELAKRY